MLRAQLRDSEPQAHTCARTWADTARHAGDYPARRISSNSFQQYSCILANGRGPSSSARLAGASGPSWQIAVPLTVLGSGSERRVIGSSYARGPSLLPVQMKARALPTASVCGTTAQVHWSRAGAIVELDLVETPTFSSSPGSATLQQSRDEARGPAPAASLLLRTRRLDGVAGQDGLPSGGSLWEPSGATDSALHGVPACREVETERWNIRHFPIDRPVVTCRATCVLR